MRTTLLAFGAVIIVLTIGALNYIPLSAPKEICKPVARWDGTSADWQLDHPMGLAWSNGFLYVADAENGAVKIIGEKGKLIAEWKGFKRPVAVAVMQDGAYVADFLADQVVKLNPKDGAVLARWGQHGNAPGEFDAPSGVGVDTSGFVYVTEFYNHRIQKLTSDGAVVTVWGTDGRWNGQFHYPTDVAVDKAGHVFVADAYNHRIEVFTTDGAFVNKWGGIGYGISGKWSGWFRLAKAVTVDYEGNIYVADAFNRRIQKFSSTGRLLGAWGGAPANGEQGLKYPSGVATAEGDTVYVSDFFNSVIWKIACPW